MEDIYFGEKEVKYKKKKAKKKNNKSNHKHQYEYCYFVKQSNIGSMIGKYCTICGKLYNINIFPSQEQIKEAKKHQIFVPADQDIWRIKYV